MSNKKYPWAFPQDNNGRVVADPLGHLKQSDTDIGSDPFYEGLLAIDGTWCIIKTSNGGATVRYATGSGNYATAWANRASLGYDRIDTAL